MSSSLRAGLLYLPAISNLATSNAPYLHMCLCPVGANSIRSRLKNLKEIILFLPLNQLLGTDTVEV